jgi:hypothetical protein
MRAERLATAAFLSVLVIRNYFGGQRHPTYTPRSEQIAKTPSLNRVHQGGGI